MTNRFELDGPEDRARLRIDLVDFTVAMLPDPERAFRPGHSGCAAVGCRDRRQHTASLRVDLLDAILGNLEQMFAVEGGSRVRGDIERAHRLAAVGVNRVQRVAGRDPHAGAVIAHPVHMGDAGKGTVFADDGCCCSIHKLTLSSDLLT